MPDWLPPTLTAVGMVVVGVLTFLGTRYAARQSGRAAARTADAASRQVDVSEWQAIISELRLEIRRLTDRVASLEEDRIEERAAHRSLLTYTRTLLAWIHRTVPGHTPPQPPAAFVDELTYITER